MISAPPFLVKEEKATYQLDQDGLWKKIITDMFEPFMLFFAPDLYEKLDWSKTPDSLEQELYRVFPVKKGTKYTDKLMKVHLKNGEDQWILIHVEVQGSAEENFAERMFQYFYRIFDKYQKKIFAIAIFTDASQTFKPATYEYQFHGTYLNYTFNTYKLLDQDEEKLLQSDNPFSYAVLAGIYRLKSKKDVQKRFGFKRQLFELLLRDKGGNAHAHANELLIFVDYLLELPEEMTATLQENIKHKVRKEDMNMEKTNWPDPPTLKPFIDEGRKRGRAEGIKEGIKEGIREGRKEAMLHIVKAMLQEGYPAKEIIKLSGISETELAEIKESMKSE